MSVPSGGRNIGFAPCVVSKERTYQSTALLKASACFLVLFSNFFLKASVWVWIVAHCAPEQPACVTCAAQRTIKYAFCSSMTTSA